ncbi:MULTISPECIES: 1-phosphofructokinase [Enterococcus]|uniref:Tagatose-6-phosphate kinase n=1 Tax=Candidatus Enterococcus mangumiae TaxID=2230878 RepID=A0ABZ2SX44_9ENTE|nr:MULTISPECIES: 1-phosphofructokinase [unclassified Enterococcus]MBO0489609.1 1-phosphofructokinase [Enterococcus sp. DIV1094]MBO1298427.1 1-phosphofructokinase [Enterococcus sp. DIV1271a]
MANVYTCTMNLAIDLFIEVEQLKPNIVNRSIDDDIQANGKGVNVSLILKKLGIPNTALGFSGGFTGAYIEDCLTKEGIEARFVSVPGMTRINVFTQVNEEADEYKLVNRGPEIDQQGIEELLAKIKQLSAGDYLCVSGSLPRGVPEEILVAISKICHENGVRLILDTSAKIVTQCLKYQPFLLKPNEQELAEWFEEEIAETQYVNYCQKLLAAGAQHVLLSLGEAGGIYVNKDYCLSGNAPQGKVVNTACAGDTLLGTFLAGMIKGEDPTDFFTDSLAAGSSTAFQKGLTDFTDVAELKKEITIHKEEFR